DPMKENATMKSKLPVSGSPTSIAIRRWVCRHVLIAVLLSVAHSGLYAQTRPMDFTPEERAQVTDAVRQFRRTELPRVAHSAAQSGWVDADRVVYSTREI